MPKVSQLEILAFNQEFEKCVEKYGDNELAINTGKLRDLVSLNRDAANGFIELYCAMAKSQPAYFMTAYTVAFVYEVVFEDDSLKKTVLEQAKALNAMKYIMDIKVD
jgi:hypothetical protein